MSILLFVVGALAFVAGTAMIGFGIPDKEFSVGSTLIISGMTAAVGGLIIVGLGIAVSQLQRLADALATRAPIRSSRPFDTFDSATPTRPQAAPASVPFPPKTKPDPRPEAQPGGMPVPQPAAFSPPRETVAPEPRLDEPAPDYAAPTLPNPDEPPVTAADEAFLSPLQPASETPARRPSPPPFFGAPALDSDRDDADHRDAEAETVRDEEDEPPAPRKSNTYFDAMWPAEPKLPELKAAEPKPAELKRDEDVPSPLDDEQSAPADEEPRAVAILKSGVVDGMGYTLYVDGSIEAELPQGTLRFASINELRSHLEKTS